jgi:hypothetical protein
MPDFEVVGQIEDGKTMLRFLTGAMAGRVVIAVPDSYYSSGAHHTLSPYERAERLLLSLLTVEQAAAWGDSKRFFVETPFGTVEFGQLSNMRYWPRRGEGELRLCVVPADHGHGLPDPDIWANLLLALKDDPRRFFTVAHWRAGKSAWRYGPVPGLDDQRAAS